MKKLTIAILAGALLMAAGLLLAQSKKPKSVMHVITLYWKDGTTDAQKQAALAAVDKLAASYPGIRNVWTKPLNPNRLQGNIGEHPVQQVIVMEFTDEQALKNYSNSPQQKAFYEAYLPVRGESRTNDVTN